MRRSLNSTAQRLKLPNPILTSRNMNDSISRKSESQNRQRAISPLTQLVHTLKSSYENTKKGRTIVSPKRTRLSKLIQSFQAPKESNKFPSNNIIDDNDRPLGTLEFINKVKTNLEKIKITKEPRRKTSVRSKKFKKSDRLKLRYYLTQEPRVKKTKPSTTKKKNTKAAKPNSFSLNGSTLLSPKRAHRSQFSFFIAENDLSLVSPKADFPLKRSSKRNEGIIPFANVKENTAKKSGFKKSIGGTARLFDVIQKMRGNKKVDPKLPF